MASRSWSNVHPVQPTLARRWLLLGMACSLAFDRFARLYRKYREDQLRNGRGEFADEGGRQEPETTGSFTPTYEDRTGDPLIDRVTDELKAIVSDVHDLLGDGEGAAYGPEVPLIEIRTRAGIRIKEMNDVLALWSHDRELLLSRAARADHTRVAGRA